MNENKRATFKRKVLKRIFSPKRNTLGEFKLRINQEIEELFGDTNIINVLKKVCQDGIDICGGQRAPLGWPKDENWTQKSKKKAQTALNRQNY